MRTANAMNNPILTIDPRRQFGDVCIEGTRTPASAIAGCVFAGDAVDYVADSYDITREQVLLACWWYARTSKKVHRKWGTWARTSKKVHRKWGTWSDTALSYLGGWEQGDCPDPPVST